MTRRVAWSSRSRADLASIARYILEDDPVAAAAVVARLRAAGTALGKASTGHPGRVAGTYEKVVAKLPYIIAYAVDDSRVTVLTVIHTARHWPSDAWPGD